MRFEPLTLVAVPFVIAASATFGTAGTPGPQPNEHAVEAVADQIPRMRPMRVFEGVKLRRPIQIVSRPDHPDLLYVVEQPGRVLVLDRTTPDMTDPEVFLDIRPEVRMKNNEEGLLAMAFSPGVTEDGLVYLYYSASSPRRSLLSRFRIGDDDRAIADSEEVLLEIAQPFGNHNGGDIAFGPDGMLYLSIGDGGAAADPMNHAQNLGTPLGSVFRIDVNGADEGRKYRIPSDNPFVGVEGALPETWAYGTRNIWRMSFDRETGELWAGDVGQNKYEEIDLIRRGGNYGWRMREGMHAFTQETPPAGVELVDPVVEYPRGDGISVTGGFVYRGDARPEARGVYLYGDYRSGRIWGIRAPGGVLEKGPVQVARMRGSLISSFGQDADGELWICTFEGEEVPGHGAIWRFTGPMTREVSEAAGSSDTP